MQKQKPGKASKKQIVGQVVGDLAILIGVIATRIFDLQFPFLVNLVTFAVGCVPVVALFAAILRFIAYAVDQYALITHPPRWLLIFSGLADFTTLILLAGQGEYVLAVLWGTGHAVNWISLEGITAAIQIEEKKRNTHNPRFDLYFTRSELNNSFSEPVLFDDLDDRLGNR